MADNRSKIRGIIGTIVALGTRAATQIQWKNNSGVSEFKNFDDSAFAICRGADPVGDDDLVTYRKVKGISQTIRYAIGIAASQDSTAQIPANSRAISRPASTRNISPSLSTLAAVALRMLATSSSSIGTWRAPRINWK